ncbi:MAG: hypothetical protein KKC68_07385 [Candidatus Thermoplasmatota archaeon]|nr:hypothetical protein [Candidatus Thermoplasmatota archaeon]MBU1941582.1 hypothetical protein [Candidatus Thermoplasmatota archaeon]
MTETTIELLSISTLIEAKQAIENIQVDPKSIPIMTPKAIMKHIKLHHIHTQDAIIIKQDMLSIGGDVAIPKETFYLKNESVSILIFGTLTQVHTLVQKLRRHYPRLQKIANQLNQILEKIE